MCIKKERLPARQQKHSDNRKVNMTIQKKRQSVKRRYDENKKSIKQSKKVAENRTSFLTYQKVKYLKNPEVKLVCKKFRYHEKRILNKAVSRKF